MNIVRLLILLAVLVVGLIIGALNSQPIIISLGFTQINSTTGVAIIIALLSGALIGGGLVLASMVIPLYAKLRRAQKAAPAVVVAPLLLHSTDAERRWNLSPSGSGSSCACPWPRCPVG
ncbi:LapA family protein [Stenotrophomonas rhizophila]